MIAESIQKSVADAIKRAYGVKITPEIMFPETKHGDIATNVAFQLAKELKQSPKVIAETIAENHKTSEVETAVAVNGFINFTMTDAFWVQEANKIDANYLKNTSGKGEKVQVEFISANPTGPLTLGNARGGYLGDVLANVLDACSYSVYREYYFNDAGTQITKLLRSLDIQRQIKQYLKDTDKRFADLNPEEISRWPDPEYKGEYLDVILDEFSVELKNKDPALSSLVTKAIFERFIEGAIKKMGIHFDTFFNEASLSDTYQKIIKKLEQMGLTEEKDGALWLKSQLFGDDRDRVLEKSNGDVTYLGNDLAYHANIFEERKFQKAIKIWGADHAGQVPSLKLTVGKLFPDKKLDFIIMQFVRLIKDGKEVKMSKRAGDFVTIDELIAEIPSDVARFFFVMREVNMRIDFDLDLAKEESKNNPYYYVMYTYARTCSILQKAKGKKMKIATELTNLSEREEAIIRSLHKIPMLIEEISASYEVYKLVYYGLETAKLFNEYYENEKVLNLPELERSNRLLFLEKYRTVMEQYFGILGVTPRDSM